MSPAPRGRLAVALLAIGLLSALASLGLLRRPSSPASETAVTGGIEDQVAHTSIGPTAELGERARQVASPQPIPAQAQVVRDFAPHPYPSDATRARLARERQLIGALNDAMDLSEPERMRPLIAQYRTLLPSDDNQLAAGYERIADCLEDPSDAARAAARRYYDQERASTLRRFVRRHCF